MRTTRLNTRHGVGALIVVGLLTLGVVAGALALGSDDTRLSCRPDTAVRSHAIAQVVASSSSASRLYVVTRGGAHFRTDDGKRWQRSPTPAPGVPVLSLGKRSDVLFAGSSTGFFRSDDMGRTWRTLACDWIVLHAAGVSSEPNLVYVGTGQRESTGDGGGLYRTTDGGRTWKRFTRFPVMNERNRDVQVVTAGPKDPRQVHIGLEFGGVQSSSDAGGHWRFANIHREDPGLYGPQLTSLAFGPGRTPALWAGSRLQGVFRGDVTARKWTPRGLRGHWIYEVVPDARKSNIVYARVDSKGLMRSVDGGARWRAVSGLPVTVTGLTVQSKNNTLYAWTGRTVFRSRDYGVTWKRLPPLPS